ncbi:protein VAPYRIN-like [Haliotis rubra]|uniref:protein VAPYRIN-like n=1 Tax=Haliotis rubra TaxID=36100 RepID=UPI001EE5EFC3|nr:protein VAPYRIN-like [Haliotis rubra]
MEARRPGPPQSLMYPPRPEGDTLKSGTPCRPGTRATPTPARRDARADADLYAACREGNLAEVKRILDTGRADVNCRDVDGRTPVMWAALWGHRDVVELLVSRGADVSLVDDDGNNTLHYACMRRRQEDSGVCAVSGRGGRQRQEQLQADSGRRGETVDIVSCRISWCHVVHSEVNVVLM